MKLFRKKHLVWLIQDAVQQYWADDSPFGRCRNRYLAHKVPIVNCINMLREDYDMTVSEIMTVLGTAIAGRRFRSN